jgi:ABC-2 type transport system ATP-binding protein
VNYQLPGGITTIGLGKDLGGRPVLDAVDLDVPPGSVHALLGPNGAGKTTLVRILSTLLAPDRGTALVAGFDVRTAPGAVRRQISLTGQSAAVDELQTGLENLEMIGRLLRLGRRRALGRAHELLEKFDLTDAAGRLVKTWSGGMRRRLDLAASLVVQPSVLFLDEPTSGLDPRSRLGLWDAVGDLAASGTTILLTTQYLEEADRLADRVSLLDHGRVVAEGTPAVLKTRVAGQRLDLVFPDGGAFDRAARLLDGRVVRTDEVQRTIAIGTNGSAGEVHAVLDELAGADVQVATLSVVTATLDDVFLALTGRSSTSEEVNSHG